MITFDQVPVRLCNCIMQQDRENSLSAKPADLYTTLGQAGLTNRSSRNAATLRGISWYAPSSHPVRAHLGALTHLAAHEISPDKYMHHAMCCTIVARMHQ